MLMSCKQVIHFRHRLGDGVHYITNNQRVFGDGTFQLGDTSEVCILLNLDIVLSRFRLPTIDKLWNQVYPNDYMSVEDIAYILSTAVAYTENFNPTVPDNIADVLKDVRAMQCFELADLAEQLLKEKGATL